MLHIGKVGRGVLRVKPVNSDLVERRRKMPSILSTLPRYLTSLEVVRYFSGGVVGVATSTWYFTLTQVRRTRPKRVL